MYLHFFNLYSVSLHVHMSCPVKRVAGKLPHIICKGKLELNSKHSGWNCKVFLIHPVLNMSAKLNSVTKFCFSQTDREISSLLDCQVSLSKLFFSVNSVRFQATFAPLLLQVSSISQIERNFGTFLNLSVLVKLQRFH